MAATQTRTAGVHDKVPAIEI